MRKIGNFVAQLLADLKEQRRQRRAELQRMHLVWEHWPELRRYIEELVKLSKETKTSTGYGFLKAGKESCRKIGNEIYSRFGRDGMVFVCEKVGEKIGGYAGREVEAAWDGIGDWRG